VRYQFFYITFFTLHQVTDSIKPNQLFCFWYLESPWSAISYMVQAPWLPHQVQPSFYCYLLRCCCCCCCYDHHHCHHVCFTVLQLLKVRPGQLLNGGLMGL